VRGPGKSVQGDYKAPTGETLFEDFPKEIEIAGKTGTAQGLDSKPHLDSSAFVAYERGASGEYVIGAYLERSGYGSKGAAPVVKCLFLMLRAGYPVDPVVLSEALDTNSTVAAPPKALKNQACLALPVDNAQRER
jgi:penicillin-binding protein 2